jgi:hypothetical protein
MPWPSGNRQDSCFPSLVTGILRTIKGNMVERRLGSLAASDLRVVDRELRRSLAL